MPELLKLVLDAKHAVLEHLRNYANPCCCRDLMRAVLDVLSIRERKDGTITRVSLPIDRLAFIIAYKRLADPRIAAGYSYSLAPVVGWSEIQALDPASQMKLDTTLFCPSPDAFKGLPFP